jgi:hypothetical protein
MKNQFCLLLLWCSVSFLHAQSTDSKIGHFKLREAVECQKEEIVRSAFRDDEYALVVGFTDPNEILTISSDTLIQGNVIVVNKGKLLTDKNVKLTIKGGVILLDSALFRVKHSELELSGNLMALQQSAFVMDSASLLMPMDYRYQYALAGTDQALVKWTNSLISFGHGQLSGVFLDQSDFVLHHNEFLQSVTVSLLNQSGLDVENTTNAWEFLLADSCSVRIRQSSDFIFWLYFSDQQKAEVSFPLGNYIPSLHMNSSVYGLEDIHYSLDIDSGSNIKWGVIQEAGSELTIINSMMRTFGMLFDHGGNESITGFVNNQFYKNDTFHFSDRTLQLINTDILTWNFYSVKHTHLLLNGCLFGEALAFDEGVLTTAGSICDGSGGYLGAENGQLEILASEIEAQLLTSGHSLTVLAESEIDFSWLPATFTESSIALFANTERNGDIVVHDTAFVLEVYLDTFKHQQVNSLVPIEGSIQHFNGPYNPSFIRYYRLRAKSKDGTTEYVIADSLGALIEKDVIGYWNTNEVQAGDWELIMSVYINQDTDPVEVSRWVYLHEASGMDEKEMSFLVYPNPCMDFFDLQIGEEYERIELEIVNLLGQRVYHKQMHGSERIDVRDFEPGMYVIQLSAGNTHSTERLMIK